MLFLEHRWLAVAIGVAVAMVLSLSSAFSGEKTPMPKGPHGQKRKADVIGNAVHVMRMS